MNRYLLCILLLFSIPGMAQDYVTGTINETAAQGEEFPLAGVSVYWLGTSTVTQTDTLGVFKLPFDSVSGRLVLTYIGYQNRSQATIHSL